MNASGVIERLLSFGGAMVGHLPGGLAQVNVVSNLIFSGMSGSAVADASGPGLIVARMDDEERPLSGRFRRRHLGRLSDARTADADIDPDDFLRADRQCFGRRHVPRWSGAGGVDGAVDDGRDRNRRPPSQLSA